jgi:hypothetical protein
MTVMLLVQEASKADPIWGNFMSGNLDQPKRPTLFPLIHSMNSGGSRNV